MDIIAIHDFRVETQIGFYEWERRLPQMIQLDLELGIPGSNATPRTDRLGDTIDYYVCYGPDLNLAIAGYRKLTGDAPMFAGNASASLFWTIDTCA